MLRKPGTGIGHSKPPIGVREGDSDAVVKPKPSEQFSPGGVSEPQPSPAQPRDSSSRIHTPLITHRLCSSTPQHTHFAPAGYTHLSHTHTPLDHRGVIITHTHLAHRGMNRCLTLLVIKEMETKTPLNLRLAKIQNRDSEGPVVSGRTNWQSLSRAVCQ